MNGKMVHRHARIRLDHWFSTLTLQGYRAMWVCRELIILTALVSHEHAFPPQSTLWFCVNEVLQFIHLPPHTPLALSSGEMDCLLLLSALALRCGEQEWGRTEPISGHRSGRAHLLERNFFH